jgi:hypothetical protein
VTRLYGLLTFVFGDHESPSLRSVAVLNGRIGLVSICSKQTTRISVLSKLPSTIQYERYP